MNQGYSNSFFYGKQFLIISCNRSSNSNISIKYENIADFIFMTGLSATSFYNFFYLVAGGVLKKLPVKAPSPPISPPINAVTSIIATYEPPKGNISATFFESR